MFQVKDYPPGSNLIQESVSNNKSIYKNGKINRLVSNSSIVKIKIGIQIIKFKY